MRNFYHARNLGQQGHNVTVLTAVPAGTRHHVEVAVAVDVAEVRRVEFAEGVVDVDRVVDPCGAVVGVLEPKDERIAAYSEMR